MGQQLQLAIQQWCNEQPNEKFSHSPDCYINAVGTSSLKTGLVSDAFVLRKSHPLAQNSPSRLNSTYMSNMVNKTSSKTSVLFDFDGTLCNSETPAMEVAYIELAPYLGQTPTEEIMLEFLRLNAGKAFEFMIEAADKDRAANGLPPCEQVRKENAEDPKLMEVIDPWRQKLGLKPLKETTESTLLELQKNDTLIALGKLAEPVTGCIEMLTSLTAAGLSFCIATTSGKPRVPVCVDAAKIRSFFPTDDVIHSGESDFVPPRFKPAPDVYLKAAEAQDCPPNDCVAVEDSGSGVGSAANAGIGLIVGYVGATHIPESLKESHAQMLMSGEKSQDGRGADIVLRDIRDLIPIVKDYEIFRIANPNSSPKAYDVKKVTASLTAQYWLPK